MNRSEAGGIASPFRRGVEALSRRRFLTARRLLTRAVQSGGPEAEWAGQELVQTFLRRGDADQAEPFLRRLLPDVSSHLHHLVGYLYRRTGRSEEAARHQEAALRADRRMLAAGIELAWIRIVNGLDYQGKHQLERSARIARRRGDVWGEAIAVGWLSTRAMLRFELRQALILLPHAAALKRQAGDPFGLARVLSNTGLAYYYLADYEGSITTLRESLALEQQVGDREAEGRTLNNLGNCYRELFDLPRAEDAYRRSIATARRSGDQRAVGGALGNLARIKLVNGNRRGAERLYRLSLQALEGSPDADFAGSTLLALMLALTTGRRPGDALEALECHGHLLAGCNGRTRSNVAQERARALLGLGLLDEARSAISLARMEAIRAPGPHQSLHSDRITIEEIAGRIEHAGGNTGLALRILGRAERRVESLLAGLGGSILRMGLLTASRAVVDSQVECLLAGSEARINRAWRTSAATRARELCHNLLKAPRPDTVRGLAVRDEIEAEARRLAGLPHLGRSGVLQLRRLQKRYIEALEDPAGFGPGIRRHTLVRSPPLDRDTALIEYHVADEWTEAFILHHRVSRAVRISWGRERLTGDVDRLTRPLLAAGRGEDVWAELDGFDLARANTLFRKLVEPAITELPPSIRRLVIVPDGPLHRLPFDALVTSMPGQFDRSGMSRFARARYLGDDWIVSYSQSSLLLGPPVVAASAPRLLVLAHSPGANAGLLTTRGGLSLRTLPGASEEARSLSRIFPGAHVLLGVEATIRAYQRRAPTADIVHLAAHAFTDHLAPGLSGVVLAGRGGSVLDFLSAERIARIPLRANLVTLSACDSGQGRDYGREGVLGLVRSFHQAGARAVLASLWPVDDLATRDLMRVFYRHLVAGHDRAQALAEARRSLRQVSGPSPAMMRSHPYFWAAMILVDHAPGRPTVRGVSAD